jgi:hypothetical protein
LRGVRIKPFNLLEVEPRPFKTVQLNRWVEPLCSLPLIFDSPINILHNQRRYCYFAQRFVQLGVKMIRVCSRCNAKLTQNNKLNLCYPCLEKPLEQVYISDEGLIDAEGYASIVGLESAEALKRLARDGKLAPRIPGIKRWLWYKEEIETWTKQEGRSADRDLRGATLGIASNLRRCRNDSFICLSLSDEIGTTVYGEGDVMGVTDTGRVEPIKLVNVDRSDASDVLKRLPKKEFPELLGISGWDGLTYDRISEGLIVRLEAYF